MIAATVASGCTRALSAGQFYAGARMNCVEQVRLLGGCDRMAYLDHFRASLSTPKLREILPLSRFPPCPSWAFLLAGRASPYVSPYGEKRPLGVCSRP